MKAWGNVRAGSEYAGVSPQTFRPFLKDGLEHVVLPSGTILVHRDAIDEYLRRFIVKGNKAEQIANEVIKDF